MKYLHLLTIIFSVFSFGHSQMEYRYDYDPLEAECLVCEKLIEEVYKKVDSLDPTKLVNVGQKRLDHTGNYQTNLVPLRKSETHLVDLLDAICEKFEFIKAKTKKDEKLVLLKLMGDDGKMNPMMSEVNLILEDKLNENVKYYCQGFVEEYLEELVKYIVNDEGDVKNRFCVHLTKACPPAEEEQQQNEEL